MLISEKIDTLYPDPPKLTVTDFQFIADMTIAKKRLDEKIWLFNGSITELSFDDLYIIYFNLMTETSLFYRDEWRALIHQELYNKINNLKL